MQINKIYFDMDGVLADFDRGVKELCGLEPIPQNDKKPKGYDDELWAGVRNVDHFYLKLEPVTGAIDMFQQFYERFGDKCEILTGIPKEHRGIVTAAQDKKDWVAQKLPPGIVVHTVYREDKKTFCKDKHDILIDDYRKNIDEWNDFGGTGLLFEGADKMIEILGHIK